MAIWKKMWEGVFSEHSDCDWHSDAKWTFLTIDHLLVIRQVQRHYTFYIIKEQITHRIINTYRLYFSSIEEEEVYHQDDEYEEWKRNDDVDEIEKQFAFEVESEDDLREEHIIVFMIEQVSLYSCASHVPDICYA